MDAFTGKETVCFNIKVLDEHLPVAVDILSDMVLHPVFDANEIIRERGVILEEIKMDEDNPDYLVHEIFTQNFFKGSSAGQADPGNQGNGPRASIRKRSCGLLRRTSLCPGT